MSGRGDLRTERAQCACVGEGPGGGADASRHLPRDVL